MDISKLIDLLTQGEQEGADYVLGLVNQDDVDAIGKDDYLRHPSKYTGAGGEKTLANDTFNDIKHFLRGKIHGAVDVAWNVETVRKPLRTLANQAAATLIATPPPAPVPAPTPAPTAGH